MEKAVIGNFQFASEAMKELAPVLNEGISRETWAFQIKEGVLMKPGENPKEVEWEREGTEYTKDGYIRLFDLLIYYVRLNQACNGDYSALIKNGVPEELRSWKAQKALKGYLDSLN